MIRTKRLTVTIRFNSTRVANAIVIDCKVGVLDHNLVISIASCFTSVGGEHAKVGYPNGNTLAVLLI